jgi:uncharacterized protein YcbX
MTRLTGLFLYPVKSLRGCAVPTAQLDALGLVGDRRFMIVDDTGKFMTQRSEPRLAQIATRLDADGLILSVAGAGSVTIPTASDPAATTRSVAIWKSEGLLAEDCGAAASAWLGDFLGQQCHLVRIGPRFSRPRRTAAAQPGDAVAFTDAYPLLAVSEASLGYLNDRIRENQGEPVPMNRFRPGLVVDGCEAFAEDGWTRVRIGETILRQGGPCARCLVTTTDQFTGERGKEPLKTLATFRRDPADPASVNFGANLIHETKGGTLRVGDRVDAL